MWLHNPYMEEPGKAKKPYHGIWIPFILILIVPLIAYVVFYNVIKYNFVAEDIIHVYAALFFSGLVGSVFDIICILSGFVSDLFVAFAERIKETKEMFGLFTKEGFKYYWHCFFHDGGPIFWILLIIIIGHAIMALIGAKGFFEWYFSL